MWARLKAEDEEGDREYNCDMVYAICYMLIEQRHSVGADQSNQRPRDENTLITDVVFDDMTPSAGA